IVNQTIMPIKTFEYIAFGLPAVCSDVGHMGRITREYNTGIAVAPDQISEIAGAMKKLISDTSLYSTQRSNCLVLYEKKFNWKYMEQHLAALYDTMLIK
ncbi:MAG: glycosyltransferase, partial [Bacteroidota bacterium]